MVITMEGSIMEEILTMNNKERQRLKVMTKLNDGSLTQKIAAKQLGISTRQIKRLYKRYTADGDKGVISRQRGSISNNSLSIDFKDQIAELIKSNYSDFGPTLAHEKLHELHNYALSVTTVRNIMIEQSIWIPRSCVDKKIYKMRDRRECYGELVQMDGSYHDWFEGRAPKCRLLVLIDDATSDILSLEFVPCESSLAYFSFMRKYLLDKGRPLSLYTDRHAVFETTRSTDKSYKKTQFNRAMEELGIELILAFSPQAKGRVERANGTLQDRLVKELRLAGISNMEDANDFLHSFILSFNKKFGKQPKCFINAHRSLDEEHDLDRILSLQHERKITKDLRVYY